jgi:branched-chain amino acid transport system substrate-binding protein
MGSRFRFSILIFACSMFFCAISAATAQEVIKIGGMFALSGPWANIGVDQKNSCKYVFDKLNSAGGIKGRPIKFIEADTEGDPTKALLAAKRLVEKDGVAAIIGPVRTGVGMAIKPYIDSAKVPVVMHCGGDAIVDIPPTHWVFKTPPRSSDAMRRIFDHMRKQGLSQIGFLCIQGGFGKDAMKNIGMLAPEYGIQVVGTETFDGKDIDMKPQIVNLRDKNPKAILIWAVGPAGAIIAKNMRELDYQVPQYQCHGEATYQFLEIAGAAAEGTILPSPPIYVAEDMADTNPQKALLLEFDKDYTKTFKRPSAMVTCGVDATNLVVKALREVGDGRHKMRYAIENTKGWLGLNGTFDMSPTDHCGLSVDDVVLMKVQEGKFRLVRD